MEFRRIALVLIASSGLAVASSVLLDAFGQAPATPTVPPRPTSTLLFAIRKSENRNRVEYAIRLDSSCRPSGAAPVRASWRLLEEGPNVRESLDAIERPAYGIARQRVDATEAGARVALVLRALPSRAIEVRSVLADGRCRVTATTEIDGAQSTIDDILVVLHGPLSIDHLELRGHAVVDGSPRFERIAR